MFKYLMAPCLDLAMFWVGRLALLVVDGVAFDGNFCDWDLNGELLALGALRLLGVHRRRHSNGVANLILKKIYNVLC